jgi:hypothetical protein
MALQAMRIFLILMGLGLAFMVYVLIQFVRDGRRKPGTHQRGATRKLGRTVRESQRDEAVFSKTPTGEWSLGNEEIQIRNACSDGRVGLRCTCSNTKPAINMSRNPESGSKAG